MVKIYISSRTYVLLVRFLMSGHDMRHPDELKCDQEATAP